MCEGKQLLLAMGMAIALHAGLLAASEAGPVVYDGMTSLRRNAAVTIGGELRVDYSYRRTKTSGRDDGLDAKLADLSLRQANLRIRADVHPNLKALFKMDLSADDNRRDDVDAVFEEALLVMHSIGGTGLGFFAGKGKAPYGQDVTLGMLQSYNHAANRADSSEGRIFIIEPPAAPNASAGGASLPPMRPGQLDRTFMAGLSYEWSPRWRLEAAAFQPGEDGYAERLDDRRPGGSQSDIGFAARLWWNPIESLVLEASAVSAHSSEMGRSALRTDLAPGAKARSRANSLSLGFDWRRGPWQAFGEYQHAWNWNFASGYDTNSWQLGAAREFADAWRVGAMVEHLRISDQTSGNMVDNYYKLTLNVRYVFSSGVFILAEYGHEWFRRARQGELSDKRRGDFLGMRLGFSF